MREPLCSPCAPRITVAIADDYPVMREGLARIINDECDLVVAGSAATGRELRQLIQQQPPRVLVMELMLHDGDGLALITDLMALAPALRIVVFSLHPEEIYADRSRRAGAHAYVMKNEPVANLLRAIRDTAAGRFAISPPASVAGTSRRRSNAPVAGGAEADLTNRELEVFRLAGLALPTRVIAEKLGISVKTVETHREHVKNKLALHTHAEFVARAAQWLRDNAPR